MNKIFLVFILLGGLQVSASAQSLAMRNYPPKDITVQLESSNLPLVWITTTDTLSRYTRCLGRMKIINNVDGINYSDTVSHPGQTVEFDGPIAIKWRGASSFGNDGTQTKKPMSVKTLKTDDINGKKDKVKLLGMGKDNDWCFLAPWQDRSYIRDILTMQLARGGNVFVPQMRYCEVFVDDIYYGLFILSERATSGSKRLDLWDYGEDEDSNPIDDSSGDFHVEIDRPENKYTHEKEPHYTSLHHPVSTDGTEITDRYITYQYKDPEEEDFADRPEAREALHKAIDDMEDAFASEDYTSLYADYIDVGSFIDYEIAQEVSNNIDGYRLSTPMWKYSTTHALAKGDNDKWKMALWDFNLAYGGANYFDARNNVWRYDENDVMTAYTGWLEEQLVPFYWHKLMNDGVYVNSLQTRYSRRRNISYSDLRIAVVIDSLAHVISQGAADRDKQAWKINWDYLANIESVRQYLTNRLVWIDERWYQENMEGITIYYDNNQTQWEHVYVYSWLNNGTENAPWPGIELREKDFESATGGYYKAVVPYSNVIFNDGTTDNQTEGYLAVDGHIYQYEGSIASVGLNEYIPTGNSLFYPSFLGVNGDNVVKNIAGALQCGRFVLSDGYPYINSTSFHADEVLYSRPPSTSRWGTVFLPFDLISNEDIQYYSLQSINDDTMTFEKVDGLPAGYPGVFKLLKDDVTSLSISMKDVEIKSSDDISYSYPLGGWSMKGTYDQLENIVSGDGRLVFFISQDHFWDAQSPISISPFRAWFETANAPSLSKLRIVGTEELETIEDVSQDLQEPVIPYDLSGHQIRNNPHGLLIVNGKVVFRK